MFRRIGWQMLLVGMGFLISAAILIYLAATYTTEFRPAPGGTYVESIGGYPQSLNPLLSFYNDADSDVVSLVFSGLTRLGMNGEVEPDLAVWAIDATGITYTFQLNRSALWHDGAYVTADDVLFTTSLLQDPDYPGPPDISALWRSVRVYKLDDYAVQFVLQQPFAPFLDYTTIPLLPAHKLTGIRALELPTLEFNRQPIGTGPFRIAEEIVTEQGHITMVSLKRFPRYYGKQPYIENLILRFYPTPRAAFEAYQDGIVEGISRIPTELLLDAFAEPDLNFHSVTTAEMLMVYFNSFVTDTIPFNDTRVRQALFYGLDRQALVDTILLGQAVLPQTPLLPGTWAYTTEGVPAYEYNLERAQTLLAEAGWVRSLPTETLRNAAGLPFAFSLLTVNEQQDLAVARALGAQWARLGISVTLQPVPPLALSGVLESRTYEAALARLVIPGDPDPYPFWHETQALPGQGQNYAGFQDRRISEIVEQARITVNRERRLRLYQEFQQRFMEEVPALPLLVPVYTYGVDVRVNGEQVGPLMRTGDRFRTIADWYVLQRRVVASVQQ